MEVNASSRESATVSPEAAGDLPPARQRAREWRSVDCSTDSSVSCSAYALDKIYPYVEIGKHLQELRTLVRESCGQDVRSSQPGPMSHEFGRNVRRHYEHEMRSVDSHMRGTSTYDERVSNDEEMYSIKIGQDINERKQQWASSIVTPRRPPRYAVVTPEESLLEAISTHEVHNAAHEKSSENNATLSNNDSRLPHQEEKIKKNTQIDQNTSRLSKMTVSVMEESPGQASEPGSSPETTVGDIHGAAYWKQVAQDMEKQMDEAQRSYSAKLVTINVEHEELEERQQQLLEQLGERLSQALRGEQFWKQTLKKVINSRKYKTEFPSSSFQQNEPFVTQEVKISRASGSEEGIMSNSVLRQELISEGIEVPSAFDWSVSSNGNENETIIQDEDLVFEWRNDYSSSEKRLRECTTARMEMLQKQNAALVAGLSAMLKRDDIGTYRSALRRVLSSVGGQKPYSSADNERYSIFIDSAFSNYGADYSEQLFSELAEFEVKLTEEYDAKLRSFQKDVQGAATRHAETLQQEASENSQILLLEREKKVSELKNKHREHMNQLLGIHASVIGRNSVELKAVTAELQMQKKKQLSEIRCRIESEYTKAVNTLTEELREKEERFAAQRRQISSDFATSLTETIEIYGNELQVEMQHEVDALKIQMQTLQEKHVQDMDYIKNKANIAAIKEIQELEEKMKNDHNEKVQSLKAEIAALTQNHDFELKEMSTDHELAVEEEKLALYTKLRQKFDEEISAMEQSISRANDLFVEELKKTESKITRQKTKELNDWKESFQRSANEELEEKNIQFDKLKSAHLANIEDLKNEHKISIERAKAETKLREECKHSAEKVVLMATLNSLKESLQSKLEAATSVYEAQADHNLLQEKQTIQLAHEKTVENLEVIMSSASTNHVKQINAISSSNADELKFGSEALVAKMEDDYMGDMCRISGEIDIIKLKHFNDDTSAHDSSISIGVQTEPISKLNPGTDIGVSVHLPCDHDSIDDHLSELIMKLESEDADSIKELRIQRSIEMNELRDLLNRQLMQKQLEENCRQRAERSDELAHESQLKREMHDLRLQLADARREESTAKELLQAVKEDADQSTSVMKSEILELKQIHANNSVKHRCEVDELHRVVQQLTAELTKHKHHNDEHKHHNDASKLLLAENDGEINNLLNINAKLQEHISSLEDLVASKFEECGRLTAQVQSMFRLIDIYRGQHSGTTASNDLSSFFDVATGNINLASKRSTSTFNMDTVEQRSPSVLGSEGCIEIDGITYTSSQLYSALKKTVKQKNSAQGLCRQQQLCIMALRLLVHETERNYEKLNQKLRSMDDRGVG